MDISTIVLLVMGAFIVFIIGLTIGFNAGQHAVRMEAIMRGKGKLVPDKEGAPRFKWVD